MKVGTGRPLLLLCVISLLLSSCSDLDEAEGNHAEVDFGNDLDLSKSEIRSPGDPILGNISSDGKCDESVIDIDHDRPTAHIIYKGQPGDKVEILISYKDHLREADVQSFEMSSMQTEMQIPTSIPNADIASIHVKATGRVGVPGECFVDVS